MVSNFISGSVAHVVTDVFFPHAKYVLQTGGYVRFFSQVLRRLEVTRSFNGPQPRFTGSKFVTLFKVLFRKNCIRVNLLFSLTFSWFEFFLLRLDSSYIII